MASDTIMGGIRDAIESATTGWKVEFGFNTDVGEWIQANVSTGKTILVTFDTDEPQAHGENGRVRRYAMSFSVFMRTRSDAQTFIDQIWPTYRAMRDALDGLAVNDGGVSRQVRIGSGSAGLANGFAVPTLQLTVQ